MQKQRNFNRLFVQRQLASLTGQRWRHQLALVFILSVALMALAYADGSLKRLKERMDDPFTNIVNFPYRSSTDKLLRQPGVQERYEIEQVKVYDQFNREFLNTEHQLTSYYRGRVLDVDDALFDVITGVDFLVSTSMSEDSLRDRYADQCGVIVTSAFLKALGHGAEGVYYLRLSPERSVHYYHYLPVLAVVSALPNKAKYVVSSNTKATILRDAKSQLLGQVYYEMVTDPSFEPDELRALMPDALKGAEAKTLRLSSEINLNRVLLEFNEPISRPMYDRLEQLTDSLELIHHRWMDMECYAHETQISKTNIAVYFQPGMEHIMPFRGYMEKHKVPVDLSSFKAKENFKKVATMTRVAALFIITLALIGLYHFINSLLRNHFSSVRKNLAALVANGIAFRDIRRCYTEVVIRFLMRAVCVALVIVVVGSLGSNIIAGGRVFQPLNLYTLIASVILMMGGVLLSIHCIDGYLKHSPGDIINNRV